MTSKPGTSSTKDGEVSDIGPKIEAVIKPLASNTPWHELPTVRDLARRFKRKQAAIMQAVEDSDNLDLIVGFGTNGAAGKFEREGDFRVEWMGD